MPQDDPICPNCSYSLQGHTPIEQADPDEIAKIICPECGHTTSLHRARSTPEPNQHPYLTAILAIIVIASIIGSCCLSFWYGLLGGQFHI